MSEVHAHVVVIGGGIAGLAAAWRLEQLSPAISVTLIEAEPRLGGWIRTEHWGEVIIEHGPDSWVASKPAATELARALGLESEIIGLRAGQAETSIMHDGRLLPLPSGLSLVVPTRLRPLLTSPLLSPLGKLRLLAEYFVPPRLDEDDESLASFVRRRFGREFAERVAEPLLSGIFAGDAGQLSVLATYPQLRRLERERGSLLRARAMQARRPAGLAAGSPFLTLRSGMERLVRAVAGDLQRTVVRTGATALGIAPSNGGFAIDLADGTRLEADGVILAVPAWRAARLFERSFTRAAAVLQALPYASSAAVTLVYRQSDLAGFARGRGFLVPAREGRPISAVTWVTNKFPARAPEHLGLVRVFFRAERAGLSDDAPTEILVAVALQELRSAVGLQAEPLHAIVSRHERALPQYCVGHRQRVAELRSLLGSWPGLALAGAAYDGVGVSDCIASGWRAAEAVLQGIGARQSVGR
jgi:oxygen-dependent protoporphyrinogen oxidase